MAHFYGEIQGSRGAASRLGGKNTGMRAAAQGWEIGAKVQVSFDEETGKDTVRVYRTTGSNGRGSSQLIAEFTADTPFGEERP